MILQTTFRIYPFMCLRVVQVEQVLRREGKTASTTSLAPCSP